MTIKRLNICGCTYSLLLGIKVGTIRTNYVLVRVIIVSAAKHDADRHLWEILLLLSPSPVIGRNNVGLQRLVAVEGLNEVVLERQRAIGELRISLFHVVLEVLQALHLSHGIGVQGRQGQRSVRAKLRRILISLFASVRIAKYN